MLNNRRDAAAPMCPHTPAYTGFVVTPAARRLAARCSLDSSVAHELAERPTGNRDLAATSIRKPPI
eukprot:CAMPEP_0119338754 /NCGR_PEP_ID=MMETSP1333-20130426/96835_1 /TAXON_ID=418940 /ORGANISM="Scyphosphaera apsteinii, Strain RCC1455" /LENGTH=65 /DNA_ID=CAMNT_0007350131 /DNA_START=464 /DNA_END=661 /DNA_ORIENTATION=-